MDDGGNTQARLATDALQQHAKLQYSLRKSTPKGSQLYENASKAYDYLKHIKSELEGSHVQYQTTKFHDIQELHRLSQLTTPHWLKDYREEFERLITESFVAPPEKILFATLHTCPWYSSTQREIGQQARHNTVLVVYQDGAEKFYSPATAHLKDEDQVTDKGWFLAVEVFHFIHFLIKGKSRLCEMLFAPENSIIFKHPDWHRLLESVDIGELTRLRGFLEQCRGQAVGNVGKKGKDGKMKYKEGATLYEFCESFRLLHHASQVLSGHPPRLAPLDEVTLEGFSNQGLDLLKRAYHLDETGPIVKKQELFNHLLLWKHDVDEKMKKIKFTQPAVLEAKLGQWMSECRHGCALPETLCDLSEDKRTTLSSLMEKIGGPLKEMHPEQIVMIAQAGSSLYGLAMETSDIDYIVVYAETLQRASTACSHKTECYESRGPEKSFEYGMYEVRLFTEMVLKGSVVILELLFTDSLEYTSSFWQDLTKDPSIFLTELAIDQYLGLIKNNIKSIRSEKFKGAPRERKLFYQIFHKLYCLQFFLRKEVPIVKPSGDVRDFIMRVRRGPLDGDISRENLLKKVEEDLDRFYRDMHERKQRLPELMDYKLLTKWLLSVRGLR